MNSKLICAIEDAFREDGNKAMVDAKLKKTSKLYF